MGLAGIPLATLLTSQYPRGRENALPLPLTPTYSRLIVVLAPYPNQHAVKGALRL